MAALDKFILGDYDRVIQWLDKWRLTYGLAVLATIHIVYHATKHYLDYREDTILGRQYGCQMPPELPKKWPLGLDWIKELWDRNAEGRLLLFLCDIAKDYEPGNNLYQYFLLGPRYFHLLHPKNVESILSTNFHDYGFGARKAVFSPLLGNGIFTQEGSEWRHSRDLLRRQFTRTQYRNLNHFCEHVDNLLAHLPEDGVIDMQPLFFKLTLDTTTALLFGRSVYSLRANIDQDVDNRVFSESFNIAQEGLAKRFRIIPFHSLYYPQEFREACSNVHRFVDRYIEQLNLQDEKNSHTEGTYGFISQVAAESANYTGLRDQLLNVLIAWRDTTACCLSWTVRLLVRHASVMVRLHEEVSSVMGESTHPSREQIRKMPYLARVIKESLRLYPPVPLNNRQAKKTTILPTGGGSDGSSPILVRKGEIVGYSQYVSARLRSIYGPDAECFRPERWEGDELASIGWAYFPFNGGPRQCLGEDFALMEVSYTLVRLLQACPDISLPQGVLVEPIGFEKQRLTLVLSSADGCQVRVRRQ